MKKNKKSLTVFLLLSVLLFSKISVGQVLEFPKECPNAQEIKIDLPISKLRYRNVQEFEDQKIIKVFIDANCDWSVFDYGILDYYRILGCTILTKDINTGSCYLREVTLQQGGYDLYWREWYGGITVTPQEDYGHEFPCNQQEVLKWATIQEEKKNQEDFDALVSSGDENFNLENYEKAKHYYQEAFELKPKEIYPQKKIAEADSIIINLEKIDAAYDTLINKGDKSFDLKLFEKSKQFYNEAIVLKPDEKYPATKIADINKIISFLAERKIKIYDYSTINKTEFESYESEIISEIKASLKNENVDVVMSMNIIIMTDTSGAVLVKTENNSETNQNFEEKINSIVKSKIPKAALMYGYPVASKGIIPIKIQFKNEYVSVKKYDGDVKVPDESYRNSTEIETLLSGSPNGRYKINLHEKSINDIKFSNSKIENYKTFGNGSSAILSVFVPGLGDAVVTNGNGSLVGTFGDKKINFLNSPLATTVAVYGLLGTGYYYHYLSNQKYDRYLSATQQTDIDQNYKVANQYHHRAIIIGGIGASLWLTDIIWVGVKGHQNKKDSKYFRKQFSFNYNPTTKSYLVGCSIKF